jgi:hypothetical protein
MATHVRGNVRMTVRAVPLSHRELEFLAERYRTLRRAGTPVATLAMQATLVVSAAGMIGFAFLAIGAPMWEAALFAVVASILPPFVIRREKKVHERYERHERLSEAA